MTTGTPDALPPTPPPEGRAHFRDLLAAEWIKVWSLRSATWVLSTGALLVIGINVQAARSNADRLDALKDLPPEPPGAPDLPERPFDPLWTAFVDPAWHILIVLAASFGALALSGEYASGLIRTTFAAVPDRAGVTAAKAAVVSAVMLAFGTAVAGISFGATQWLLRDHGGLSLGDPGALRAVAASALLAPLAALVGMAVGAVVRHAAGGVVMAVCLLLLLPSLFQGETYRWVAEIGNMMPLSAWGELVANPSVPRDTGTYPLTTTEAWVVYVAWAVAAVASAVTVVRRRDV